MSGWIDRAVSLQKWDRRTKPHRRTKPDLGKPGPLSLSLVRMGSGRSTAAGWLQLLAGLFPVQSSLATPAPTINFSSKGFWCRLPGCGQGWASCQSVGSPYSSIFPPFITRILSVHLLHNLLVRALGISLLCSVSLFWHSMACTSKHTAHSAPTELTVTIARTAYGTSSLLVFDIPISMYLLYSRRSQGGVFDAFPRLKIDKTQRRGKFHRSSQALVGEENVSPLLIGCSSQHQEHARRVILAVPLG